MKAVLLAGGTGGAKLAHGLQQVLGPGELSVIVNVGDDTEQHGLLVCPDLDTILYTLAGLADIAQGWGGSHPLNVPTFVVSHSMPELPEGWPRDDAPFTFVTDATDGTQGVESAATIRATRNDATRVLIDCSVRSLLRTRAAAFRGRAT